MGVCQDLSGFMLWPVEAGGIHGPQVRGTVGTLGEVSWGVETEATRRPRQLP
jgi:hypothetical protein